MPEDGSRYVMTRFSSSAVINHNSTLKRKDDRYRTAKADDPAVEVDAISEGWHARVRNAPTSCDAGGELPCAVHLVMYQLAEKAPPPRTAFHIVQLQH